MGSDRTANAVKTLASPIDFQANKLTDLIRAVSRLHSLGSRFFGGLGHDISGDRIELSNI
jgi:hypothetical protein